MEKRAASPRREANERNTWIINDYLDKYVYTQENGFTSFERVMDRQRQVKGIDVILGYNGTRYYADEKAASDYINREFPLQTFSLELAFVNRDNIIMDGWFLNDEIRTDSYVFVWIDTADMHPISEDKPDIMVLDGIDAIKSGDVAIVDKEDVEQYLESLGWTKDKLRAKCDQIIDEDGNVEMGNVRKNGCKFSYSTKLVEQPVNVLVPRDKMIQIAKFHKKI